MNLCQVMPRFSECVRPEEQDELVNNFTATANAIVAAVDVEEILHGGG